MPLETIQNDAWKLTVSPEVGASIAALSVRLNDAWHPLLRDTPGEARQAGNPSLFSSFTLAPFSNRLKDARFDFLGRSYQLKATSPDGSTQHGDVRGQNWFLSTKTDKKLEFLLDTRELKTFNFPFHFVLRVSYELESDIFITRMKLSNAGQSHMPAGFGIHPYFNRHVAGSEELRLEFQAEGLYEVDDSLIPTGKVMKPSGKDDFSEARAVTDDSLNHLYRDWSGLRLIWPDKASLDIYADLPFKHLVVFTHADGSLAIEPVTNATNGFNLMHEGFEGHGVKVLAPEESFSGSIFFKLNNNT